MNKILIILALTVISCQNNTNTNTEPILSDTTHYPCVSPEDAEILFPPKNKK